MNYPKQLNREDLFPCPIWFADEPNLVKPINKICDKHIKKSKKIFSKGIQERNKKWKINTDRNTVYHSNNISTDPQLKDLVSYVIATSQNLLNEMGFNLDAYTVAMTEMWVQEFAKDGGGHHLLHTHWNGHISGFLFLKGSEKTSGPMFQDPRPGSLMNLLPEKDPMKITYARHEVFYKPIPGRMMFFPSYMPHLYTVDMGIEPFRFIHWNVQAIPKFQNEGNKDNKL